jgi:hypothetical protein
MNTLLKCAFVSSGLLRLVAGKHKIQSAIDSPGSQQEVVDCIVAIYCDLLEENDEIDKNLFVEEASRGTGYSHRKMARGLSDKFSTETLVN